MKAEKSKNIIKATVITGFASALVLATPAAAFASNNHDSEGSWWRRMASSWSWRKDRKSCEAAQVKLDKKAENVQERQQENLDEANELFTTAQNHVTTHTLTVENYDAHVADSTEAQTTATEAVGAIESEDLDCDDNRNWRQDERAARHELGVQKENAMEAIDEYESQLDELTLAILES